MPVMVKALGYYSHKGTKGLLKVKTHLKYLEREDAREPSPAKDSSRLLEQDHSRVKHLEKVLELIFGQEREIEGTGTATASKARPGKG